MPTTLQIRNESDVSDILKNTDIKELSTNNTNEFERIHTNSLVAKGVDILKSETSEIIRSDDGSFVIAKKETSGTLLPLVRVKNKELMETFLTHIINTTLRSHQRDTLVEITKLNEKREISISYEQEIADLKKEIEIPHVEEIGQKMRDLETIYTVINKGLRDDIGAKYKDQQFRINEEIIKKITDEHFNHIQFINEFRKDKL